MTFIDTLETKRMSRQNTLGKNQKLSIKQRATVTIVSLYLSTVIALTFANHLISFIALFPLCLGISCFTFSRHGIFQGIEPKKKHQPSKASIVFGFLFCFVVLFLGQAVYWLAYYPGGFNLDALGQWEQVHGAPLNNWHPVAVTLLYWAITRIYDSLSACILVQLIAFSLVTSLLLTYLYITRISLFFTIIIAGLIALNPAIGLTNICLYKDVPFSILIILIYFILIRICDSNGGVLSSIKADVALALLMTAAMLTRHNGIFLILGIFLSLILWFRKKIKRILAICIVTASLFFLVEGPLYSAMHVIPHENPVGEAVGIPMSVMANAYLNDSEDCPEQVKMFLYDIEPDYQVWKNNYVVGWWDSCKWTIGKNDGTSGMLLQDESLGRICQLMLMTIHSCPDTSYQAIREATRCAWQAIGNCNWFPYVYIEDNFMGIVPQYHPLFAKIASFLFNISSKSFLKIYLYNFNLGFCICLLLWLCCVKKNAGKKALVLLPAFFYNFGTALLLCSPNIRYFYYNEILLLPVAVFLYHDRINQ